MDLEISFESILAKMNSLILILESLFLPKYYISYSEFFCLLGKNPIFGFSVSVLEAIISINPKTYKLVLFEDDAFTVASSKFETILGFPSKYLDDIVQKMHIILKQYCSLLKNTKQTILSL